MVTLMQQFAQLNEAPPDNPTVQTPPDLPQTETASNLFAMQPRAAMPSTTMNSPSGHCTNTPAVPLAATPTASLSQEEDYAGLNVPTSFGMYQCFKYMTRNTSAHMLAHLILHNGVNKEDIVFEWVTLWLKASSCLARMVSNG